MAKKSSSSKRVRAPARGNAASHPLKTPPASKAVARAAIKRDAKGGAHDATALAVLEQFRLIFRSAKKHFQWVQERTGVSGAQLWVLAELRRQPGIRVTDLARAMAVHQTTASNLVERLERLQLLKRERFDLDHRVVQLTLTKKGRDAMARAPLPLEGVLPDALGSMAHDELVELQKRLDKLTRLMKVRDVSGRRIPLGEM